MISTESLTLTGRPCSGPTVFPVRARWSSSSRAFARACSKNISVQHTVSWCAIAALFEKAVTTCTQESCLVASFSRRTAMSVVSVMASSSLVSRPHERMYSRAFGASSTLGSGESVQSRVILDAC